MNEAQFRQQAEADGYNEVKPLSFEPNVSNDMHMHDFAAYLLILEGEFELHTEDGVQRVLPGETCKLPASTLHSERSGAEGARGLVAKS